MVLPQKKGWFSDPNNRAGWDHELLEASFGESTVQFGSLVGGGGYASNLFKRWGC